MTKPRTVVILAACSALSLWLLATGAAQAHTGENHSDSGLTLFQTYGQFALAAMLGLTIGLAILRAWHGRRPLDQQTEPRTDQARHS